MRHGLANKKLNRTSEHRKALLMNMLNSLIKYEQITTTLPKAKFLKPEAERIITLGKKETLHTKKMLMSKLQDKTSTQKVTKTVHQNQQATALQSAASELEASFPVFDQNSADYNETYTQEVIDLRDAFIVQGYDAVDALSKASNFVVKSYDLDTSSDPTGTALTKSVAPKAKPVDEVAKKPNLKIQFSKNCKKKYLSMN